MLEIILSAPAVILAVEPEGGKASYHVQVRHVDRLSFANNYTTGVAQSNRLRAII